MGNSISLGLFIGQCTKAAITLHHPTCGDPQNRIFSIKMDDSFYDYYSIRTEALLLFANPQKSHRTSHVTLTEIITIYFWITIRFPDPTDIHSGYPLHPTRFNVNNLFYHCDK